MLQNAHNKILTIPDFSLNEFSFSTSLLNQNSMVNQLLLIIFIIDFTFMNIKSYQDNSEVRLEIVMIFDQLSYLQIVIINDLKLTKFLLFILLF